VAESSRTSDAFVQKDAPGFECNLRRSQSPERGQSRARSFASHAETAAYLLGGVSINIDLDPINKKEHNE